MDQDLFAQQFRTCWLLFWDIFYNEGWKILYRIVLALLKISENDLMELKFEKILKYLQDLPSTCVGNEQRLLHCALNQIKITTKQMEEYEEAAEVAIHS